MLVDRKWEYVALCCCLLAFGCGAPTVLVTHALPPAVPVGDMSSRFVPGSFAVEGKASDDVAALAASLLGDHMPEAPAQSGKQETGSILVVGGLIRIESEDRLSKRSLLKWDSTGKRLQAEEVPSLVRQVVLEAHFVVTDEKTSQSLVTIETKRIYDSTADPRTRGELALGRSDDPKAVPATDKIVAELLTECVQEFWQMVTPMEVRRQIALRPIGGPDAAAAFEALEEGDLAGASAHLQRSAQASPDSHNVLYDLGVIQEASGQLADALASYRQAAELASSEDVEAAAAARRVRLVMIQQDQAAR